jgi:hypothetical protein
VMNPSSLNPLYSSCLAAQIDKSGHEGDIWMENQGIV